MQIRSSTLVAAAAGAAMGLPGAAAELSVKLTLPTVEGNGRRAPARPYVAVWIRDAGSNAFASNLAVWYQLERRAGRGMGGGGRENASAQSGARWLNEVRQWWADSGNSLRLPVDGLSGATRAAGTHELVFAGSDPKLAGLKPGKYLLMVEAAREHGGDETVSLPFTWPVTTAQSNRVSGRTELGAVELTLKP